MCKILPPTAVVAIYDGSDKNLILLLFLVHSV